MTIYRLVRGAYEGNAFRGSRGRGRWHHLGTPMVYTADQPATALLETLVHAERAALVDESYVLFRVTLREDRHLIRLPRAVLPADWKEWPWPASTQDIGTYWHEREESVVMQVPSAVAPFHSNYLINPRHPHFAELQIEGPTDFAIDPRLGEDPRLPERS